MTRPPANIALAICVLACALLAACAAPGETKARHPIVPVPVADLTWRQIGNEVVLTFTLPTQSADHTRLTEQPSVEIYRAALPPGATADRKTAWRLVYEIPSQRVESYVKEGRMEFHDPLSPDDFGRPAGSSMAYSVRTRVVKARASDDSNFFTAHIYPPPPPPQDLRISVTEAAMVIRWMQVGQPSESTPGGYRVYRAEMETGQEGTPVDLSQMKLKSPLELVGTSSTTDFSDTNFEFGRTYLYTVRSVARFGQDPVESADSSPAVGTPRDVFPPAMPSGLEAAIMPATPQTPPYVELSWAISSEGDLAGYFVYRSDGQDTPGQRINTETLPSPAFRDISVVPGGRYFYRVSAIDRAGNESPKSSAVQADVPISGQ